MAACLFLLFLRIVLNYPHPRWFQFENSGTLRAHVLQYIFMCENVCTSCPCPMYDVRIHILLPTQYSTVQCVVQLIRAIPVLNAFGNSHLWKKIKCPAYCFRFFFSPPPSFHPYQQSSRSLRRCPFLRWIAKAVRVFVVGANRVSSFNGYLEIYCNRDNKLYYFV